MSKTYTQLKAYACYLANYIALDPLKTGALREELLRMSALCERMENKQEILFETQKYQSKMNQQAPIELKEKPLSYNPYKG